MFTNSMNVSRFSLSQLSYKTPTAPMASRFRFGKLAEGTTLEKEDKTTSKESDSSELNTLNQPIKNKGSATADVSPVEMPAQQQAVSTTAEVDSFSSSKEDNNNQPVTATNANATPQQPAMAVKKNKHHDWVPAAVAVGLVGTAATTAVLLPQWLERNKPLEQRHKDFMSRLVDLKPYSKEDYAKIVDNASDILNKLKGPDGDKWLKEQPQLKYYLESLLDKSPQNEELAFKTFKRQLTMECINAKYGMFNYILSDIDGTMVFKNLEIASGVEENSFPSEVLMRNYHLSMRVKLKAALKHGFEHPNDPDFKPMVIMQDMKAIGMYGKIKTNADGTPVLNSDRHVVLDDDLAEAAINLWTKNFEKAVPKMTQKELDAFLEGPSFTGVTARGGGNGTIFNSFYSNPLTGDKGDYNYSPFGGMPAVTKMDPTLCYEHYDVHGIGGAYVVDRQLTAPRAFADASLSGLIDKIVKAGFMDKVIYKNAQSPLKQVEPKGVLRQAMTARLTEMLKKEVDAVEALGSQKGTASIPSKEQVFDGLVVAYPIELTDEQRKKKTQNQIDIEEAELVRVKDEARKAVKKQWENPGVDGNLSREALLNRYYMATQSRPAYTEPIAWETKSDAVLTHARQCLTLIEQGGKVPEGAPQTKEAVAEYLKSQFREINNEDIAYFNATDLKPHTDADGNVTPVKNPLKYNYAKKASESVLTNDSTFQVPLAQKHFDQLKALTDKGSSLALKDVEAFNVELNTLDVACLTVHTIEAELRGFFADYAETVEKFPKDQVRPTDLKKMILESEKWQTLKALIQSGDDPTLKADLEAQQMGILRITSADPSLCYPSKAFQDANPNKKYLFNVLNNSASLDFDTYVNYDLMTATEKKNFFEKMGVPKLADPTSPYVEIVLNIALQKGASARTLSKWGINEAFHGDSSGTDMSAIIYQLLHSPFSVGEAVRNMITDPQMKKAIIEDLNINSKRRIEFETAKTRELRSNGFTEDQITSVFKQRDLQIKAIPLMYEFTDKEKPTHVRLIGTGHDLDDSGFKAILKQFKKDETGNIPIAEYEEKLQRVIQGLFLERCLRSNDVTFSTERHALVLGMLAGEDWKTQHDLLKNPYLAQKAMLSTEAGAFYRKNPFAFALGMPFDASFASEAFKPANLKASMNRLARDPYGVWPQLALRIPEHYLNANAIGGIMAVTGGLVAIGTALTQLATVWSKPTVKAPSTPAPQAQLPVTVKVTKPPVKQEIHGVQPTLSSERASQQSSGDASTVTVPSPSITLSAFKLKDSFGRVGYKKPQQPADSLVKPFSVQG
ncbi:MAG: hypothetical protein H2174_09325 [Vampirovibrio sp.]|nr:hypothetical protein [Vampirovibrio sp.]